MYVSMYVNTTEQARRVQCTFPHFATTSCLTSTAANRISSTARPRLAEALSCFRARDGGGACSRHGRGDVCTRCVGSLAPQFRGIHDRARARRECTWRPRSAVPEIHVSPVFADTEARAEVCVNTQTRANTSAHHSFFHLRFTSASKASKSNSPPLCASAFNIPLRSTGRKEVVQEKLAARDTCSVGWGSSARNPSAVAASNRTPAALVCRIAAPDVSSRRRHGYFFDHRSALGSA